MQIRKKKYNYTGNIENIFVDLLSKNNYTGIKNSFLSFILINCLSRIKFYNIMYNVYKKKGKENIYVMQKYLIFIINSYQI